MSDRRFREVEVNNSWKTSKRYVNYDKDSNCYGHSNHSRYENYQNRNRTYYDVNDRYDNRDNHNFRGNNYEAPRRYSNNDRSRNSQVRDNRSRFSYENSNNSFDRSRSRDRNFSQYYPSDRDRQKRYRNNYNPKRENATNYQRNRFNDNCKENRQEFNNRRYQNKWKRCDKSGPRDDTNKRNKGRDEEDRTIKTMDNIGELKIGVQSENNHDITNNINEQTRRTDDYLGDEKCDQPIMEEDDRTGKRRKLDEVYTENRGKPESSVQYENSHDASSAKTNNEIFGNHDDYLPDYVSDEEYDLQEKNEKFSNKTYLDCNESSYDEDYCTITIKNLDDVCTENNEDPENGVQNNKKNNDASFSNTNKEIFGNQDDDLPDYVSDEEYDLQ